MGLWGLFLDENLLGCELKHAGYMLGKFDENPREFYKLHFFLFTSILQRQGNILGSVVWIFPLLKNCLSCLKQK